MLAGDDVAFMLAGAEENGVRGARDGVAGWATEGVGVEDVELHLLIRFYIPIVVTAC